MVHSGTTGCISNYVISEKSTETFFRIKNFYERCERHHELLQRMKCFERAQLTPPCQQYFVVFFTKKKPLNCSILKSNAEYRFK